MSGMNERTARPGLLKGCILLCIGICLLFALVPLADIDLDGSADSFLTDGLLSILALPAAIVPVFFMTGLPSAYLASPRSFFFKIVPPPVTL